MLAFWSCSVKLIDVCRCGDTDLHICFTLAEYRRRGAGSMMLQWGCDVADALGIAGWIEASAEGNFLYKCHGFYEHSKIEGGGINMTRDAKQIAMRGGK